MPAASFDTMAMLRSDVRGPETAGATSHDHAAPHLFEAGRVGDLHVANTGVDAVGHQIDPLAHLVAGQSPADHPADHLLAAAGAVKDV
jgi:hypothetical protein